MAKRIITISREFGSGGRFIGEDVYAFSGCDITGKSVDDMLYEAQRKVILEIAEKEPCVMIGRNADFILKDRDDVLNVFIHGDMPEKIKRICKLYDVTEDGAVKLIKDTDKRRRTNYNLGLPFSQTI